MKPVEKGYLRKVRINNGGYDPNGAYYGVGEPVYEFFNDGNLDTAVRAKDRATAKSQVRAFYPEYEIRFYN